MTQTVESDLLYRAVCALAGRCDGAIAQDGMGFNGCDTSTGHFFANIPFESWSPKSRRQLWEMIRKYKLQLSGVGIEYDEIPVPAKISNDENKAWREARDKERYERKLTEERANAGLKPVGNRIEIHFPYNPLAINEIKKISGRRWDATKKCWSVPAVGDAIDGALAFAKKWDLPVDESIISKAEELAASAFASRATSIEGELDIPGLNGQLMPFQAAGVAYCLSHPKTLLGDQMGLGKTIQALATMEAAQAYPAIVVCPATLKYNWAAEAAGWLPDRKVQVLGTKPEELTADIIILNYEGLKKHLDALLAYHPKLLVLDECHMVANSKSQRHKYSVKLAGACERILAMTGTPLVNRIQDILSILNLLGQTDAVGGAGTILFRYGGAYRGRYGLEFGKPAHLDEFHERLRAACMLRRVKSQVLPELPPKRRTVIPVELSERKTYETELEKFKAYLESRGTRNIGVEISEIEPVKQAILHSKLPKVKEWIADFLEQNPEEKLVVFGHHLNGIAELAETFDAPFITGEVTPEERQAIQERFQQDPSCRLLICGIKAAGVGLTLTAASTVMIYELGWNPATHDQAEDRCHRISQTSSVNCYYLLGLETIEERIAALIDSKRSLTDQITDGKDEAAAEDDTIFASLVKELIKG